MDRKSIVIVLLVGFILTVCTSAFVGGMAGFVAARMGSPFGARAIMPFGFRPMPFNRGPFQNPNRPNPIQPNQPNQPQPGQQRPFQPPFNAVGVVVTQVVADSPADKAGLRSGDLIVAADGQTIDGAHPLDALIRQKKVGDTMELKVQRGNENQTLKATLGASPDNASMPYLGVRFMIMQQPTKQTN